MEPLKYLEATICIMLVTTVIHQTKLSTALVGAIRYILGDYSRRTKKMEKVIKDEIDGG